MTPYEINILLHYYACAADPHPEKIDMSARMWGHTIDRFIDLGLIEKDRSECSMRSWRLTDKGRVYVDEGICAVPLPEPKWHIPRIAGTA